MKSLKQVRTEFEHRGEVISDWADREGFDRSNVYAVISGRSKCLRGESHKIAVRLGLKPDVNNQKEEI